MGALLRALKSNRVVTAIEILLAAFVVIYLIGIAGYYWTYGQTFTEAAYSAALTMAGSGGQIVEADTESERLWNGFYALSTNIFLVALVGGVVGVVLAEYLQTVEDEWHGR